MTRRGALTLLLGLLTYAVAWLFGAKAMYPAATGLVLAPLVARTWVRAAAAPILLRRRTGGGSWAAAASRGRCSRVRTSGSRSKPARSRACPRPRSSSRSRSRSWASARHRCGVSGRSTGARMCSSGCRGDATSSSRRGRSSTTRSGWLAPRSMLAAGGALLVYPRLVPLERLFSESGAHAQDGRRLLLRRPSGFDLHSVREYEQGESLRKVHWRTTARRGQLMVKELEDAPRDEIAVLLDADATRGQRRELRRPGARCGLDPARPRGPRPPCRPCGQLGVAAERARLLARRRVARRARPARRGAAGRDTPGGRAARTGERPGVEGPRDGGRDREAVGRARRRSSCSARWQRRGSASSGSTRRASPAGRPASSPSSCGCRRPGWRSPSSARATRSPRCSAPRPR